MELERIKSKVTRILTDEFGAAEDSEDNHFIVSVQDSLLDLSFIVHRADTDDDDARIFIEVSSVICFDCPISDELFAWIALYGSNYLVGNVALHTNGFDSLIEIKRVDEPRLTDIVFRYRMLGNDIDPSEIYVATYAVAESSRELRELIPGKFGGLPQ